MRSGMIRWVMTIDTMSSDEAADMDYGDYHWLILCLVLAISKLHFAESGYFTTPFTTPFLLERLGKKDSTKQEFQQTMYQGGCRDMIT